jgi:cytochrome b561
MLGCLLFLTMMAAGRKERPGVSADRSRALAALWHRGLAIFIVLTGVWGRGNLHALWGLALTIFVISRFYWRVNTRPRMSGSDVRELCRQVSRNVYFLLYAVILAKELVDLVGVSWHDGTFDFGLLSTYLQMPEDQVASEFGSQFRGYVACGVVAVVIIRVLTAFHLRFAKNLVPDQVEQQC